MGLTRAIGRFLKPGGIFISADANKHVYTPEKQHCRLASTEVSASPEGGSWLARWMYEVTSRWTSKGHMHTQGDKLGTLIRNDGQFDLKGERAYWSPINWDGEDIPDGYEIGQLMVLNWFVSIKWFSGIEILIYVCMLMLTLFARISFSHANRPFCQRVYPRR